MSIWTWLWVAWGLAFAVIEGVALFNSTRGDTLSEHAWAWLGVGASQRMRCANCPANVVRGPNGRWDHSLSAQTSCQRPAPSRATPRWTLRVARIVLISGMVWLVLHFATGGWV